MLNLLGRKVAVTGATGFVGHHAALALRDRGANVVALVRRSSNVIHLQSAGIACRIASLEDVSDLARTLEGSEVVVHIAGAVGFDNEWSPFYQVNVEGTRNLLQAAQRAGVRRFVHTSSIVAVGAAQTPTPLDETATWNLGSARVPYVTTKRWAEDVAVDANGKSLEVVVVNPASVIGPDDFSRSEFGTMCRRFWRGRLPFHFGGGNNFVDVRDVAQGICLAVERGQPGERYLLAGENRAYHAFFNELCQTAQRRIPRIQLPNVLARVIGYLNDRFQRKASKRSYLSSAQAALIGWYFFYDAGKARRELGYQSRSLQEMLVDTHAFWMSSDKKPSAVIMEGAHDAA